MKAGASKPPSVHLMQLVTPRPIPILVCSLVRAAQGRGPKMFVFYKQKKEAASRHSLLIS